MNGQGSLFDAMICAPDGTREALRPGAFVLRGLARRVGPTLLADVESICRAAPFRHMETPGGFRMSVGVTNCGALGWVSDRHGYRYASTDPVSGRSWPAMPASFLGLARRAADQSGYPQFLPDACLVNQYVPGARVTPHQDKNERDFSQPVVSVSLGLPALFQFGGLSRTEPFVRVLLEHGDTVVWGGESRLSYHGILPLKHGNHPLAGGRRINLSFRRAG
jgi:DNA oxidative demethylase